MTNSPSYEKIASGVMMHIGNYDVAVYPDKTQREVHASRRDESITYKIEEDLYGFREAEGWTYLQYRFTYRYLGAEFSVTWKCGTLFGEPSAWHGLVSALSDAQSVRYEEFGPEWMDTFGYDYETDYQKAKRVYKACERMNERLTTALGDSLETWETALSDRM